ncbi:UDP-glucose dehydrogenase family protein [Deinococcus aestuarii]|uniref:UDP-glucose dehydrogenase family protein n=1 Tax=Deinococcus aestuarii TaxID=2774531 RepID=UPI001C0C328D|nr:UDP-glucose/GDP-mannose dehydrogenase family protein [Deinococcus aestuarii]
MQNSSALQVAIVGTGYVGLTTGVALAHLGHTVVGVDQDPGKVQMLREGRSPIHEVHLEDLLRASGEQLRFTTHLSEGLQGADVAIIAVGTPPKPNGEADTRYVEAVAREIAQHLTEGQRLVVVVKSTVPIGSNQRVASVIARVLRERQVQAHVSFASNPEFLREGMALYDTFYPDRIVVGTADDHATTVLRQLYRPLLEQTFTPPPGLPRPSAFPLPPLVTTDTTSAEMIKYAANAFLATKISFINEIAGLCERVGADVTEVARGMGLDTRIGSRFLQAGLGWGGSCFPKDTQALQAVAAEYGYTMPIIQAARDVNARQRKLMVEKLQRTLKVLRGRTVAVLGLAFKPGTDDVRDSAGMDVLRMLLECDVHLRAYDPVALDAAQRALPDMEVDWAYTAQEALEGADAVLIATEWEEFQTLDWAVLATRMRTPVVVDGRNVLNPAALRAAGFTYVGVGR